MPARYHYEANVLAPVGHVVYNSAHGSVLRAARAPSRLHRYALWERAGERLRIRELYRDSLARLRYSDYV